MEHGLPPYVSKTDTGIYRYFRRPPRGIKGKPFIRSFRTKDKKIVMQKYAAVHAEAEKYFEQLISGRRLTDDDLIQMVATRGNAKRLFDLPPGELYSRSDWDRFIDQSGTAEMRALTGPDREFLVEHLYYLYMMTEAANAELTRQQYEKRNEPLTRLAALAGEPLSVPGSGLTMMQAYEQAWLPAANRSPGTVREVLTYVTDFVALVGDHAIKDLTREHWGRWRADCLSRYGANWTAHKRFTMMKTLVHEAIRAGLIDRKHFEGQDVVMRKPPRTRLRNEGWSDNELRTFFGSDGFLHPADPADYWIPVILAHTGARLAEVANMKREDVGPRHGMQTFYLAREQGKTEASRRIIPIPRTITDLNFDAYLETIPEGPLFPGHNARSFTKRSGDFRRALGLNRKGADNYAFRHHLKTLLADRTCPDRINDYITGHVPADEAARYGKTMYEKVLEHLNQLDLGVTIPKWSAKTP
jgi:integrase